MAEWKGGGKADRYARAIRMTDKLKSTQDTEKIKETLRNYMERVSMGTEPENEFLQHEIVKTYKKNSFIGKALEEMDYAERKELLGDGQQANTAEPESGNEEK